MCRVASGFNRVIELNQIMLIMSIKVITKLPNSEQSYKGKVKTHNYINRQIQVLLRKMIFYVIMTTELFIKYFVI